MQFFSKIALRLTVKVAELSRWACFMKYISKLHKISRTEFIPAQQDLLNI